MPGSMMSISTTSACSRPKASMASSPLAVSSTVQPSSSRAIFTAVRMRSSSSTVKMRVPTSESVPYPAPSARAGVTWRWMDSAARRWAELLDGWIIPDEILFQAPDDPWAIAPAAVAPPCGARRHAVAPAGGRVAPRRRFRARRGLRRRGGVAGPGAAGGLGGGRGRVDGDARRLRRRLPGPAACRYQAVLGEWPTVGRRRRRGRRRRVPPRRLQRA